MNKSILIIGDCCDDKWIGGFLRNCAFHSNNIDVFCVNTNYSPQCINGNEELCKAIYNLKKNAPSFLYKIPVIRRLLYFFDINIILRAVLHNNVYDMINVHFVLPELATVNFEAHTKCLILTPWGSDILRRSNIELFLLRKLFNKSQYITVPKTRFRNDIKYKMQQPDSKFVDIGMGTDMIDYILNNQNYTKEQAKHDLGLDGKYVIVCGYNAHPEQNHFQIIDAIASIKSGLPSNTVLLFPMTYGASNAYKDSVEKYTKSKIVDCVFLREYLTQQELLAIRKGADIFIHAQKTDNNSGSLAEYLLSGTKVINAAWLKYPQYEDIATPYYIFNSFNELPQVLLNAVTEEGTIVSPEIIKYIENSGWASMSNRWRDFIDRV